MSLSAHIGPAPRSCSRSLVSSGLRQVNDTQGQLAGDALLRLVGETVRANLRPYDVVLRYGGDELVGAMPHIGATECRERFERITAALTAADAEHSVRFGLADSDPAAVSESSSGAPAPTCSKRAAPVGARQARRPR